jgi:methionine aminopeptidase
MWFDFCMFYVNGFWLLLVCSDLGCHIDGFIAVVGHTHALQSGPVTGRAADVIAAANTAAEVALRLVRPGKKVICLFVSC